MTKSERLAVRRRIIDLHHARVGQRGIARALGISRTQVDRWIHRYETTGSLDDSPRRGRPKTVTPSFITQTHKKLHRRNYQSIRKTTQQFINEGQDVSASSVWRAAHQSGLQPYKRINKPLIGKDVRAARLRFARKYAEHDWHRHLFADEKTFRLFQRPNRQNDVVWTHPGEDITHAQTVKHAGKINVYAAIGIEGCTNIRMFTQNMTAALYIEILEDTLLPAAERIYKKRRWTYVQDSDPKHTLPALLPICRPTMFTSSVQRTGHPIHPTSILSRICGP